MKLRIDHTALESFRLWTDNVLLRENEAYYNYSGGLYHIENPIISNFETYASPFAQWVYDQSVSGANIPTGVFVNGVFTPRDTNGLKLDYNHGRCYFTSGQSNVTSSFARKEINTYVTSKDEVELLFETVWTSDSEYPVQKSGIPYNKDIYPAIFIKYYGTENEPYAFGGMDETSFKYRSVILAKSAYQLDGLMGIFRDTQARTIPLFSAANLPFNYYGDLKSGNFNFTGEAVNCSKMYIDKVICSRLSESVNKQMNRGVHGGYIDFQIQIHRHPR